MSMPAFRGGRNSRTAASGDGVIVNRRHKPDYQIILFMGLLMMLGLILMYAGKETFKGEAAYRLQRGMRPSDVESWLEVKGTHFSTGHDPDNGRATYTMSYEVQPGSVLLVIYYADTNEVIETVPQSHNPNF